MVMRVSGTMMLHAATVVLLALVEGSAAQSAAMQAFDAALSLIDTNDPPTGTGKAILKILANNNNVQVSNYGSNSFQLQNIGQKRIAAVFIDVTDSIFSDIVFDDNGSGGDSVAKKLSYDTGGSSVGVISINSYDWLWLPARSGLNPSADFDSDDLSNVNNLFVDSTSDNGLSSRKAGGGFRGELLLFESFGSEKSVGFSGDMDPNSIAGLTKSTVDKDAGWDVGGVSGAEMVNGVVSVLFGDGSVASGNIAADGSQAGGVAAISNDLRGPPSLSVNSLSPGNSGTYGSGKPTVTVLSNPGDVVRVSRVEGFNPVVHTKTVANGDIAVKDLVQARLDAQYDSFPVNNAKQWDHVVVTIPSSGSAVISNSFDNVSNNHPPIAFTAVIIDNSSSNTPLSETTDPIYLRYATGPVLPPVDPPANPSSEPSTKPSSEPSSEPTTSSPDSVSSVEPRVTPSSEPSSKPSSRQLSAEPISAPSSEPTAFEPLRLRTQAPAPSPTDAEETCKFSFLQFFQWIACLLCNRFAR
jgi:hypothetical protein